ADRGGRCGSRAGRSWPPCYEARLPSRHTHTPSGYTVGVDSTTSAPPRRHVGARRDRERPQEGLMTTSTYALTGLTCGHCVGAVTEEVAALEGVSAVDIDLVAGGTSTMTVTSDGEIPADALAEAVDEAGAYELADTTA